MKLFCIDSHLQTRRPHNIRYDTFFGPTDMTQEITPYRRGQLARAGLEQLPSTITDAGANATRRFIEFFTANIRNKNTRAAYGRAVAQFFQWCETHHVQLHRIEPVVVAAYIENHPGSKPTVKQHLAAIRMLFDWLVIGQIVPINPAAVVRGPKHVVKRGKTPVLMPEQARKLLDSIPLDHIVGLRDRAIVGIMCYTFARVGAVTAMRVEDYYQSGKCWWFRLHEKGGKRHQVPAHHNAEAYMDAYLAETGLQADRKLKKTPLFRTVDRRLRLTDTLMARQNIWQMIKRRARQAGLPSSTSCHTMRATGITAYLSNGGTLENAQALAAHESPRTTMLYDHSGDEITLDEVERIGI